MALGGAIGTLARYGVTTAMEPAGRLPSGVLLVNVTGAFVLGLLLELLLRLGDDDGRRRGVRLLAGVGFLGGYTTYSALALDTAELLRDDHVGLALGYGVGSVLAGLAAAVAGIVLARRITR